MGIDPFSMLELDHRHVEALFAELESSDEGETRERLLRDLQASLAAHMEFEERAIYPLVTRQMDEETAREARIEHDLAREGMTKLSELSSQPGFGAALEMLKGGISHHVEEEEGEMFPELRSGTPGDEQQRLADDLLTAKRSAGLPPVPPEATKEQLMSMAQQMGIEGRSKMARDQLVEAIAKAG